MNITDIHLYSSPDFVGGTPFKHAELSLKNPSLAHSYIIKSASGLDSDEIISKYYAGPSSLKFYNVTSPPRTVSLLLSLNPQYKQGETPEGLRAALQKMIAFTRNGLIELRFMNGLTHVASLFGLVTKFESSLFTSASEVQITFKCEYPFLRAPNYVFVSSPTGTSPSWTDDLSTAPHGYMMALNITSTFSDPIRIEGIYGQTTASFIINRSLTVDDILYISSEEGARAVYYNRVGTDRHLADKVEPGSIWPMMFPGTTRISVSDADFTWDYIKYRPTYWGI